MWEEEHTKDLSGLDDVNNVHGRTQYLNLLMNGENIEDLDLMSFTQTTQRNQLQTMRCCQKKGLMMDTTLLSAFSWFIGMQQL